MTDYEIYSAELEKRQNDLLDAMLEEVPFDGWRFRALYHGAQRLDLSEAEADLAFPGGLGEIARFWSTRSDRLMQERLDQLDLESMRIRDRVAAAVRTRIEVNMGHREALRRLLGWLAVPINAPIAVSNTAKTVNRMWYAAGDTSADWNYYSKRGLLMPVYSTTVLYWLADEPDDSGDYPATWAYLDRRIDDVLKTFGFPRKLKRRIEEVCTGIRPGGHNENRA